MSSVKEEYKGKGWGTRHTMAFLGFIGFGLNYAMRYNLSLAIVPMVTSPTEHSPPILYDRNVNSSKNNGNLSRGFDEETSSKICPMISPSSSIHSLSYTNLSKRAFEQSETLSVLLESPTFPWTERDQGLILGAFFWGYTVTQYPGGRLSQKYGAKWIFSTGILLTGVLSLLIPQFTIMWGKSGLACLRFLQGLAEGVTVPSMHAMLAHWCPPHERSRLVNCVFAGIPFGMACTMVGGGYLIQHFGWSSLFYASGLLSIVWFIFWVFLVFDKPSTHPRISKEEREYIDGTIHGEPGSVNIEEHGPTPWKGILCSLPVWAIFIAHVGNAWSHQIVYTEIPKYLGAVHHFQIQHNGWFSASPHFLNFAMCICISNFSDFLIVRKLTSKIFTRKMCTAIAMWGLAGAFLGVILGGCDTLVAVTCLNIAGLVLGASYGGWIVNNIDIASNHAGTLMGIHNTFSNIFGSFAPLVSGIILNADETLTGWKVVFLIPTILSFSVCVFYLAFASTEEQPWNKVLVSVKDREKVADAYE